jgi:hypothetical protein
MRFQIPYGAEHMYATLRYVEGFSRHRVYHITNQHGFQEEKRFRGIDHGNRTVLRLCKQWVEHPCRPLHLRLTRTTKLGDYSNILILVCRVQDLTPEYFKFKTKC